ncbi:hypothetical protein ACSSS7_006287 [Eimeria intestinalis]
MAEMLSAAWNVLSKCCTRRELDGTLNEQEQVPLSGREQIDDIGALLELLSPSGAASDGAQKKLCATASNSSETLGFSESLSRFGEPATTKPAASSARRCSVQNQTANKLHVTGPPANLSGANHGIPSRQRLVRAIPDQEGGSLSLAAQDTQTKVQDHLQSDSSENRFRWSCGVDGLPPSSNSSEDGALKAKELSEPLQGSTSMQCGCGSPPDGAAACSQGSRMIPGREGSSCAGDHSHHLDWNIQNKFSHVRMALSGGLTRAATLAFPAVQSLWVTSSPSYHRDRGLGSKVPNKSLLSWSGRFSLDSVKAAGWVASGQRFTLGGRHQHGPSKVVLDFPSNVRTIAQRADGGATEDGADGQGAIPASPTGKGARPAVSEPPASPDCHKVVNVGGKGSLAYFCLLGASVSRERSLSFKRRPLVTRPAGMPVHRVANSLGIVSLTGDSLGRKKQWCAVLKTAAETGQAEAQRVPGVPPHQKQLEHVLLLQLLQQQQSMALPPSALNSTQQVGVCRARSLWIGAVAQGLGFEAPAAAEFVTGELIKELLHRCASSETPLWVQKLDALTAERHMLETFKAVAGQLQQQQPQLGGHRDEDSSTYQTDRDTQASVTSPHAFQGLRRLREHRQLLRRRQLFLSGRASSALGNGLPTVEKCKEPCGFDSLTSGAVACLFLWDSDQQLLLVCHTGDVRAILAHPARRGKKETNPDYQVNRPLGQLTEAAAPAAKHHHLVQSFWGLQDSATEKASCFLGSAYDCVVLTREHSTADRDERRRVQGAGVFMSVSYTESPRIPQKAARKTSSESSLPDQGQSSEGLRPEVREGGPKFFCPCLLTPPLTATRSLGLCGGYQFGISSSPDIATVTLDPTLGFCFLLVATSSLWRIFTPQEAVDVVVAELWRQQRQLFEQQRRLFLKPHGSNPLCETPEGKGRTRQHTNDSTEHDVGKAGGWGSRRAHLQKAERFRKDDKGERDTEGAELAVGNNMEPVQSANLQLAADVLENRFCEEWTLQRESEPLADLGLLLLALKPSASF